jgi:hypothetical protein
MQPVGELQDRVCFRPDDTFLHDLAGSISDYRRNAFLVHIHADILRAIHCERSFL